MRLLIISALTLIALAPLWKGWQATDYRVSGGVAYVASPMFKAAQQFHGSKTRPEVDQFGYWHFYRDGKRCRLFNAKFMEKWRNK